MRVKVDSGGWELYQFPPSFVLGFHGCDESVGEDVLRGQKDHLTASNNDYDWLGTGIYFWESDPQRALDFAQKSADGLKVSRGKVRTPFVLGAVINLGFCLDLRDRSALVELKRSFVALSSIETAMPTNSHDLKQRRLDCAVFNLLHEIRKTEQVAQYDTVRATYREGSVLYPGTDIQDQDHTQICVRNTGSILGYFRPIKRDPESAD